jgi:hypothetical protein
VLEFWEHEVLSSPSRVAKKVGHYLSAGR